MAAVRMTSTPGTPRRIWLARLRRAWAIAGAAAGAVFIVWSLIAYQASGDARGALESTPAVAVSDHDGYWKFQPKQAASVGLLFFPGALVDPAAYAPIAGAVAARGFTVLLVRVPRRGAFGGAESDELSLRYRRALRETVQDGGPARWVVAGHSRGGVISANVLRTAPEGMAGLVLIGTSHPRDFSLAHLQIPVTQIYGTRDTVADVEKVVAARRNLPPSITIVEIDGGNHSQFGSYGFQPGDWPARIPRAEQQRRTVDAIVGTLARSVPDLARRTTFAHPYGSVVAFCCPC
jgi:pimeloyl-ACP methyl ester carboxylesterase